jgi:fatty acid desaturase
MKVVSNRTLVIFLVGAFAALALGGWLGDQSLRGAVVMIVLGFVFAAVIFIGTLAYKYYWSGRL